jgi:hypothetical protein
MALISVVMPCYNVERFLPGAIQSVLNQTYQDFELIIVDDGSTDGSAQVIHSFDDPRMHYLRRANGGPGKALNTGMRAATGEFVAFLDADDLMLPHRLATQLGVLEANPALSVVGSGFTWIDENDQGIFWPHHSWQHAMELNDISSWLFDCPFVRSTVMLRRRAWEDVGGFDEDLRGGEDWNFWMRLVLSGHRMAWHQEVVALYRRWAGSLSEDAQRMSADCPEALERVLDRPDFPQDLLPLGRQALALRHIDGAKRLFRSGMWDAGQAELEQAITLNPDLIVSRDGKPTNLDDEIMTGALDPFVTDPFAYLRAVLAHLPSNAGPVSTVEKQVIPRTYLELIIRGMQQHNYRSALHYLPGLLRQSDWLLGFAISMVRRGIRTVSVRTLAKRLWRSAPGHRVPA